jgi:hypothetical protein
MDSIYCTNDNCDNNIIYFDEETNEIVNEASGERYDYDARGGDYGWTIEEVASFHGWINDDEIGWLCPYHANH